MKLLVSFFFIFVSSAVISQNLTSKTYTKENGLPSNYIKSVAKDGFGNLFLTTKKGTILFDGNNFTEIIDANKYLIKTFSNSNYYIDNQFINEINKNNKGFNFIKQIHNKENLYLIFRKSIFKLSKKDTISKIDSSLFHENNEITNAVIVKDNLCISSKKGIYLLERNNNQDKFVKILKGNTTSLEILNDSILFTSRNNKLYKLIKNKVVDSISFKSNIRKILKVNNELWINKAQNGISVLSLPSLSFKRAINKYNLITTNDVNDIFYDQPFVWLATNEGLIQLKTEWSSVKKPEVFITETLVNNKKLEITRHINQVVLSPDENNLTFSFQTVSFEFPNQIDYRYKLNGSFSKWSKASQIHFSGLPHGNYTFSVQSKVKGIESNVATLNFLIEKPFYFKAWFIFSIIIAFILTTYLLVDYILRLQRKKHHQKLQKEKDKNYILSLENKALRLQMNPHFIFNVLNSIKAFGKKGNIKLLDATIVQFSSLLRSVLKASKENELTLKEEIISLTNYIELELSLANNRFNYQILTDTNNIDAEEIYISPMLIQPFVENSIKHAFNNNKGKITISFKIEGRQLKCSIEDNGKGFDTSLLDEKRNSFGISITKERIINLWKFNSFKIISSTEGTIVSFKIPYKIDY